MSHAHYGFEVTSDDVLVVLCNNHEKIKYKEKSRQEIAAEVFNNIDTERIITAAMWFDDIDSQTTAAHAEICAILQESGYIN